MRIVLDTNFLVRAIANPAGPAIEVLARILPPHVLVMSVEMQTELADVLTRDSVQQPARACLREWPSQYFPPQFAANRSARY